MYDVLGAVGCPEGKQLVIVIAEGSTPSHSDHGRVANLGQNHDWLPNGANTANGASPVSTMPSVGAATEVLRNRCRNALQAGYEVVFD